ncbi:MAG TPA: sulfotransferase [Anaerolineales bacterium]|nr:sulfotransferase [Anaerolineales bacterium]
MSKVITPVGGELPILVTGAHRSGTTWVGKMLAADPQIAYISEPLNVLHRPGVLRARVTKWYQYICDDNQDQFIPAFKELLDFRYHLWSEIRSLRSLKDFLRMGRDFAIFYNGMMRGQRMLLKDPFAVFSTSWFAKKLNFKVVVTVRHPVGFASSLKRLGWNFDFNDLLNQPLLMRDHLEPYRVQMRSIQADDIIGQAALLWAMIYRTVHTTRKLNPDIIVVHHEDISSEPVPGYRNLYSSLGLDYSARVERMILNSSSSENPVELPKNRVHAVKLDSRANMDNWKKRLTVDEINRIRKLTEETAELFYPDMTW